MAYGTIKITTDGTDAQLTQSMNTTTSDKRQTLTNIENWLRALKSGAASATIQVTAGLQAGTAASGTLTIASNSAQSVTINGVLFTGGSDYVISAQTVTVIAASIAALINASTSGYLSPVVATSALGVVTVTAKHPALVSNLFTLAATGAASASGANLTGGTDPTQEVFTFNR